MSPEESKAILKEVQDRLEGVMEVIKDLPAGYKYKVREMLSCAETVVSMYTDVKNGIIPEIFQQKDVEESSKDVVENAPDVVQEVKNTQVLNVGDINI